MPRLKSVPATDTLPDLQYQWISHLQAVTLFEDIRENSEALHELSHQMTRQTFIAGAHIIAEGQNGAELYILLSGRAAVYKTTSDGERYKVAIVNGEHHAFFGEGAMIDADVRSATIIAETECCCLVLQRSSFDSFARKYPHWAFPVFRRIACVVMHRLRKVNNDHLLLYNALVSEIKGEL